MRAPAGAAVGRLAPSPGEHPPLGLARPKDLIQSIILRKVKTHIKCSYIKLDRRRNIHNVKHIHLSFEIHGNWFQDPPQITNSEMLKSPVENVIFLCNLHNPFVIYDNCCSVNPI